jgi:uncharacterized protein (TIGR02231 family)
MLGNEQIAGSTTDFDGNYIIKPISAGHYSVKVSYVGYELLQMINVPIYPDKITFQNFQMKASSINLQEVQVTEYKTPLISKDQTVSGGTVSSEDIPRMANKSAAALATSVGGVSTSRFVPPIVETYNYISNAIKTNVANLEYAINIPYTIPSDGSDYSIRIKEVSLPVDYVYHTVPKLDNDVFLTAEIKEWNQLNLLSGKAGIYYQGTYTGESFIDANQDSDTLKVSLGRDRNILVKREGIKEMNDKRFMGSDIKETVGWNITIKNNKECKTRIVVMDQFPVSEKKSIEVERLESSGAKLDERTGKLTWDFDLEAGAKKVLMFRYSVKYPKYSGLSLE